MVDLPEDFPPMLSAEGYVVNEIRKALQEQFQSIWVYGEEVDSPAGFPCVTIEESSNTSHLPTQTADNREHYANLLYSVNVYSNLQGGGKAQCRAVMETIDRIMRHWGFLRTMCQPMPNYQKNITRMVARYTGILSENGLIYKQ